MNKFKVGDKVKVKISSPRYDDNANFHSVGEICYLTHLDDDDLRNCVRFKSPRPELAYPQGYTEAWFEDDDLVEID